MRRRILLQNLGAGSALAIGAVLGGQRGARAYGTGAIEQPAKFVGSEDLMIRFDVERERLVELLPKPLRPRTLEVSLTIMRQKQMSPVVREYSEAVLWFGAQYPQGTLDGPFESGYLLSHFWTDDQRTIDEGKAAGWNKLPGEVRLKNSDGHIDASVHAQKGPMISISADLEPATAPYYGFGVMLMSGKHQNQAGRRVITGQWVQQRLDDYQRANSRLSAAAIHIGDSGSVLNQLGLSRDNVTQIRYKIITKQLMSPHEILWNYDG